MHNVESLNNTEPPRAELTAHCSAMAVVGSFNKSQAGCMERWPLERIGDRYRKVVLVAVGRSDRILFRQSTFSRVCKVLTGNISLA